MSDYATHIPVSSPDPTGIQTLIPSFAYEPPADALVPSPWELPVDSMTEAGSRSSRRTLDAGKMAQVVQRAGGTGLEVATRLHRLATVRPSGATTPQTKVQLLPNHKWHRGDGTHRRSHVQSPSPLRIENLMDDLLVEEVPSRSSLKSHPSRKSNKSIGTAIRARAYLAEFKQTKKRHLYHQRASVTLKAQGMPSQARKGPTPVVHRYRERESWKERISTLGVPHIGGAVPVAVPASRAPAVPITQRTVASAVDAMNRSNAIIRAAAPPFVPRSPPVPQYLAANFQGIGGRPLTNPPPRATPLSPTPLPPRPTRPSPNMQSGAFIRPLVPVDAIAKPQINNFPPVIAIPKGPPPRLPAELTYEALSKHVSHGGLVRVHQANSASPLQWTGSRSSSGFGAGVFKGMSPNAYSAAMSQQRKGPWDGPWVTETVHRHITERSDEDTPWISGTFSLNWALWAIVKALAEGSTAVHLSVISPTDEIRFLPTEVLHHTRGDVRSQEAATIRRAAERGEVLFYGRIFADSIQADLVWTPEVGNISLVGANLPDHPV